MPDASDLSIVVSRSEFAGDGRPSGLWIIDYESGGRCAEVLHGEFGHAWQLWYEDGTPAATFATDVNEFNGPLVRWHPNGELWEQATYGSNEELVGTHLLWYETGAMRAKGF